MYCWRATWIGTSAAHRPRSKRHSGSYWRPKTRFSRLLPGIGAAAAAVCRPDRANYRKPVADRARPPMETRPRIGSPVPAAVRILMLVRKVTFKSGRALGIVELFLGRSVYRDRLGCELAGLGSRMSVEDSDLKLVERVQRGERAAFDLLVLRYQHKVLKLIMRYVHDATEAEDIAQEAFVKAFRALQSFRGDSAFYTWLYRIAINTAKNALVATKRRPMDYDLDLQDPEQYDSACAAGRVGDSGRLAAHRRDSRHRESRHREFAGRSAHRHRASRAGRIELRRHCANHGLPGRYGAFANLSRTRGDRQEATTHIRRRPWSA